MLPKGKSPIFTMTRCRSKPEKRLLVTGATGFIGSHLAGALAEAGHSVFLLIRALNAEGTTAYDRWNRIADWLGLSPAARARIKVFVGNLDDPDLNLSLDDARFLKANIEEIVHAAGSTSFSEKKRNEIFQTNLIGLKNILSFVDRGICRHIHAISTAYVGEGTQTPCRECISPAHDFFNPYEESKHQAEILLREFCNRKGLRLSIYRPSVVYGNSLTGRTFRFNALYHPVRSIAYLRDLFKKDLLENAGTQARKMGISLDSTTQTLHMPIHFQKRQGTGVNLIPIDYCTDAILELMNVTEKEGIFHIVNTQNTPLTDLVSFAGRFLKVSGMGVDGVSAQQAQQDPTSGALDHLFLRYMEAYQPYIEDTRIFDDSRAARTLSPAGIRCPKFSYAIFEQCMTYAVESNWGRTLGL
ncbi:SDR family oxidoreductase [Desulfuromonas sp. AOP6]|uniref:SDR family oxidoreductase n=1 Tax=Desulfuromonas sp. AOP6 TaxID=1566351 RepID=UPI0012DF08D2|nr:SDR family oxidoreductase [Desulfuromonas sp. AOP6]